MDLSVEQLAEGLRSGDRRALARAITLVESTRSDHRAIADRLLAGVLPLAGRAVRLGITGVPGVGKSTFIEAFGLHLVERGHRVAVLAVDPTSQRTGGSILGDKTRMEDLGRHDRAFIRPSPAGTTLGGVARRTREAMLLVEAAGHDVVIVETVGVGQSETAVAGMVDTFLLLLLPGGGDELQGIKKGIVELADVVVVNKADGDFAGPARHAVAEYRHALDLLRPSLAGWTVPVLAASAIEGTGIAEVRETVIRHRAALGPDGIEARRAEQARAWLWDEIRETLLTSFASQPAVRALIPHVEADVREGRSTPGAGAARLLAAYREGSEGV
jgi:LAO/AO transport system kinase